MKKRLFTLFLSMTLVLSMAVPSFAATKVKVQKNNAPKYLAIGDSIGTGVKGMQMMDEDAYISSTTFGGDKSKNWNVHSTDYCYVNRVAEAIGANKESWDGTFISLRAKDYCYFLGLADDTNLDRIFSVPLTIDLNALSIRGLPDLARADFKKMMSSINFDEVMDNWDVIEEDAYGWLMYSLFWKDYVEDINTKTLKKAVKKADVITIELGENEITTAVVSDLMCRIVPRIIKLLVSAKNIKEINACIELLNDIRLYWQNPWNNQKQIREIANDLDRLQAFRDSLQNLDESYDDLVKDIKRDVARARKDFRVYTERLVSYIREKNPDATIIITTLPNPAKGFNIGRVVESLGFDNIRIPNIDMEPLMKPIIQSMNNYIGTLAEDYNLEIADISDVLINPDDPAYFFHPDAKGHQEIADIIVKTYKAAISKNKKAKKG